GSTPPGSRPRSASASASSAAAAPRPGWSRRGADPGGPRPGRLSGLPLALRLVGKPPEQRGGDALVLHLGGAVHVVRDARADQVTPDRAALAQPARPQHLHAVSQAALGDADRELLRMGGRLDGVLAGIDEPGR